MPPLQPNRRKDDFDMTKLQKSLQQQQRSSLKGQPHVAKLSPAEIRSLNHSAASQAHTKHPAKRSPQSKNRPPQGTPPATPEYHSAYQSQVGRAATVNLPTPPHSPNSQQRRASHSSIENGHHHHQHHHQHNKAPRPRASVPLQLVTSNGQDSRTSSLSNSSHRSLPTYRGHEVTRNHGTVSMLQRPAQDIVTNPLSMFSRPRQSTLSSIVNSSSDKFGRDFDDIDPYQAQAMLDSDSVDESEDMLPDKNLEKTESVPRSTRSTHTAVTTTPPLEAIDLEKKGQEAAGNRQTNSRSNKPNSNAPSSTPRENEIQKSLKEALKPSSEVTALPLMPTKLDAADEKRSSIPTSRYMAQTKPAQTSEQTANSQPIPTATNPSKNEADKVPIEATAQTSKDIPSESNKEPSQADKKPKKRFSFTAAFLDKKEKDPASVLSKKDRKQKDALAKSSSDSKAGHEPITEESEPKPPPSTPQQDKSSTFPQSPAVRPPTRSSSSDTLPVAQSPNDAKGKAKDMSLTPLSIPGGPVYHRCACCGRLKRPPGYANELSPVFENEHLRTNFSFEAERGKSAHSRRSSGSSHVKAKRYTPIIPMEVHDENDATKARTVQASIEPPLEDNFSEPKKTLQEPARITRFSSLHNKLDMVEDMANVEYVVDSEGVPDFGAPSESQVSVSPPRLSLGLNPDASMSGGLSMDEPSPSQEDDVIRSDGRAPTQDVINVVRPPNASWGKDEQMSYSSSEKPSENSTTNVATAKASVDVETLQSTATTHSNDTKSQSSPVTDSNTSKQEEKATKKQDKADKKALEKIKAEMKELEEKRRKEHRARMKEQEKQEQKALKQQKEEQSRKQKEEKRMSMMSMKMNGASDLAPKSTAKFLNVTRPKSMFVGANSAEVDENQNSDSMKQRPVSYLPVISATAEKEDSPLSEDLTKPSTRRLSKASKPPQSTPTEVNNNKHAPKLSLGFGSGGFGDFSDFDSALPVPNLGPHFARSSSNLRDFVISLNNQSKDADGTVMDTGIGVGADRREVQAA